ncbi:MAG: T9SS type A sorting domain-containing protein [Muribaculaceae bacterium]|nr:T9SS type A sorting domain-containing protein [Muribaculaceae bacterium]
MKKTLLTLAACLLGAASTVALNPSTVNNQLIYHLSPDGNWAGAEDFYAGTVSAYNIVTGQTWTQEIKNEAEQLHLGVGNSVSNYGTILYSRSMDCADAYYAKKGVQYKLPKPKGFTCAWANGITGDESVIVGAGGYSMYNSEVSLEPQVFPLVWRLQSDGTYGEPEMLEYPMKDYQGLVPQTVCVDCISGDGRTISGQIVACDGMLCQNVVWTCDDQGKWSYYILGEELYHPEGMEYPGPAPVGHYPSETDYMDADKKAEYLAELAYYSDHWMEGYPCPNYEDYMTADQIAAYEAACYAYQFEGNPTQQEIDQQEWLDWAAKNDAFFSAVPTFDMNSCMLSDNGVFFATANLKDGFDGTSCDAYLFNLPLNTYDVKKKGVVYPDAVGNNGTVVAHEITPWGAVPPVEKIYIAKADGGFELLQDYMNENHPAIYDWMKANVVQDFKGEAYNPETGEDEPYEIKDVWFIGRPRINADETVITTWIENIWNPTDNDYYISQVMPLPGFVGIENITNDIANGMSVSMDRNGLITINGEASALNVYDLNGRLVLNVQNPGATVKTDLTNGSYIIKAEGNNVQAVAKAIR